MKKIIIIVIVVGVSIVGLLTYFNSTNKGTASKVLSERSKEFLKTQQSQGNLEFGGIDSTGEKKEKVASSEVIDVDECFSISIPFPISDNKDLGDCFSQITVVEPRAMINVYSRGVGYSTFDEDSGVRLRRMESKIYREDKKVIDGREFLIFKKTDTGYEKTALYLSEGKLFGLNLIANVDDKRLDTKFMEMLESVDFK